MPRGGGVGQPRRVVATAADIAYADGLIPSGRKERGWTADATFAERYGNPEVHNRLRSIGDQLGAMGIDVEDLIANATEAAEGIGALARLDETAGRVQQRTVEVNKRLRTFDTKLGSLARTATAGTPVALALRSIAALKKNKVSKAKSARSKGKKPAPPKTA